MKKNRRAEAFRLAEERLQPGAEVVVVGPISRTWYADRGTLCELFMYLDDLEIIPHVVGGWPFTNAAQEAVASARTAVNIHMTPAWSGVVAPVEKPDLVIALTPRGGPWEEASELVPKWRGRGVPVLCLDADNTVRFVA